MFPFALFHKAVDMSSVPLERVLGHVPTSYAGVYLDVVCLLLMGGLPWQVRPPHTSKHI
jgi:hypothetical protein